MTGSTTTPTDTPPGRVRTGRRPWVLLVLCVALLAQGAYSFVVTPEPYPAVRMPSFGGAPGPDGLFPTATLDVTIEYTDGSILRPHVSELMAELPGLSARRTADRMFEPRPDGTVRGADDPQVRQWLRERAAALGGDRVPGTVDFCWRDGDVDVATGTYVNRSACTTTRIAL